MSEVSTGVVLTGEDEDPAVIRARLVAVTGGDPAAYAQMARDSMKAAYARADERRDIAEAWARDDDVPGEEKPVSETRTVSVITQTGAQYNLAADDFTEDENGYLNVTSEGRRVARFSPGCIGAYRHEHLVNILPPVSSYSYTVGGGGGGGGGIPSGRNGGGTP